MSLISPEARRSTATWSRRVMPAVNSSERGRSWKSSSRSRPSPAAELAALHVILQRRNRRVLVAERSVGDFVKNDDLARPQDADSSGTEVEEQVGRRRAAAGDGKDARRHVSQQEGLAGLARSQF